MLKYLHEFMTAYENLDRSARKPILKKLDELRRAEFSSYPHQALKGEQFRGLYKLRVGDWRLIYKLHDKECLFVTLGHRSEVYRSTRL